MYITRLAGRNATVRERVIIEFTEYTLPYGRVSVFNSMQDDLKQIYFDALYKRVSTVKFLGEAESRPLKDVFVELTIVEEYERPFRDVEILGFMDSERRRRYQLFGDDDREDPTNKEHTKQKRIVKPNELLRPHRKAIVTGSPGCGKTTLLKYLAGKILEEKKRFPVFLELKTVAHEDLRKASDDLARFLFAKAVLDGVHLGDDEERQLKEIYFAELKANNVAIFLDGFDEVRDEELFTALCQSIASFTRSDFGQNSLIVSTRPYALNRVNLDLEQMEIAPLNQRQIEAFLNAYYQDDDACKKLLSELKQPNPLSEMVRVPILLSSIVGLYREKQKFAADAQRTDIYEAITKRLIAKIDLDKSVRRFAFKIKTDSDGTLKLDFLKHLAFERLITDETEEQDERREVLRLVFKDELILEKAKAYVKREGLQNINPIELADDVKATALLREIGDDTYAFAHLTLHEYLAAKVLAKHADRERLFSRAYFNPSLVEMEVLPMTLGLVNNAEPFYKAIKQLSESLTYTNFRLQLRGLVYDARISDECGDKIIDRVLEFITEPPPKESTYFDPIVSSLLWIKGRYAEVLIKRIASLLKDEDSNVRGYAAKVLGKIRNEKAVDALINALTDEEGYVQWRAIEALGQIGNKKAVAALIKVSSNKDSDMQWRAAKALVKVGHDKLIDDLLNILSDKNNRMRWYAASLLGETRNEQAVDALIKALNDEEFFGQQHVAEALGNLGDVKAIDPLIKALSYKDNHMRANAAKALGNFGNEKVIDALIKSLSDGDDLVRVRAAEALRQIKNEKAVDALIKTLSDKNNHVRRRAAEALGQIGDEKAVDALIKTLSDKNHFYVRCAVAGALAEIGNKSEKIVDDLIKSLRSAFINVIWMATKTLGQIGNEKAVHALLITLGDEHQTVRRYAAKALASIKENILSKVLEKSLKSEDDFTRRKAAQTVGYYSLEPSVLDALSNIAANDPVEENRIEAAKAKEMFVNKLELFNISVVEIEKEKREALIKDKYAQATKRTTINSAKGKALEELMLALFESVEGFTCKSNVHTTNQEIDVVITNAAVHPSWHDGGRLILVECKNWSKKTDRKEFDAFCRKVTGRRGECKYGFFVSLNGFTKDFSVERLVENRANAWKIIEIDKAKLKQLVESKERGKLLREFADGAALK